MTAQQRRAREFRQAGYDLAARSPRFPSPADDFHVRRRLLAENWPQLGDALKRQFRAGWNAQRFGQARP